VPFVVATMLLAARGVPRAGHRQSRVDLDLPGITLLGALVVIVMLPVIDPGLGSGGLIIVASATLLGTLLLVLWERRYTARGRLALFAPALVRSRGFVTGNIVAMLWFGSVLSLGTFTAMFFVQAHGFSPLTVAAGVIPASLARMVAANWGAAVYLRHGTKAVATGMATQVLSIGGMLVAALLVHEPVALFVLICAVNIPAGVGSGIVEPGLRVVTLGFAPSNLHGVAASFLQLTQRLSATFFVALTTGLLLAVGGMTAGGLALALVVCLVATLIAAIASLSPALVAPEQ
jgi:hypothetical protein